MSSPAEPKASPSDLRLAFFLAARFLRGRRSRLLGGTARAALGSSALGVAAMVVATSLMNGYTETLVAKMMSGGALIVVPTFTEATAAQRPSVDLLLEVPNVTDVRSAVQGRGTLTSSRQPAGLEAFLRGVAPGPGPLRASKEQLAVVDGRPGVVLGKDLAEHLEVEVGDTVDLVALDFAALRGSGTFRFRGLRITGIFETGFWLFDREYAILDQELVRDLTGAQSFYEVSITDPQALEQVEAEAGRLLGSDYLIRNWQRFNPELFTALGIQKWGLFLLLGLIVVVSTFNVVSTVVVLVRERVRDVGLLSALGAKTPTLRLVFVLCGLLLGLVGTALGMAAGTVLCLILSRFRLLSFDSGMAEIYFIDSVPFVVRGSDLAAIAVFSFVVMFGASLIPAVRVARLSPADALRTE